jgi:hypothetical protein
MRTDLSVEAFLSFSAEFFARGGAPKPFALRAKGGTQSDPFDELLAGVLQRQLPGVCVIKAGPNTSPDLVLYRRDACVDATRAALRTDPTRIVAIEVKKLDRTPGGPVARATGMDYNTTPPCGTVRIYDERDEALDVRGFYLFVCQEEAEGQRGRYKLTALALCDGDVLNADFDLYLQTTQPRAKLGGQGTYGDGAIRSRPMVIFPNPLGSRYFDKNATLLHASSELARGELRLVAEIRRPTPGGGIRRFWAYRQAPAPREIEVLENPFPVTKKPTEGRRGRFRVDFVPK